MGPIVILAGADSSLTAATECESLAADLADVVGDAVEFWDELLVEEAEFWPPHPEARIVVKTNKNKYLVIVQLILVLTILY